MTRVWIAVHWPPWTIRRRVSTWWLGWVAWIISIFSVVGRHRVYATIMLKEMLKDNLYCTIIIVFIECEENGVNARIVRFACGSRAPLRTMRAAYIHYTFLYIALLLRYSTTRTRSVTNIVVRPAAHGNRLKSAYGKIACVDRARNPPPLGSLLLNAVGTLLYYSFRRELTSKECAVLPCHHPRFLFLTRLNRTGFVGPSDDCKVSCFPNRSEQNVSLSRLLS